MLSLSPRKPVVWANVAAASKWALWCRCCAEAVCGPRSRCCMNCCYKRRSWAGIAWKLGKEPLRLQACSTTGSRIMVPQRPRRRCGAPRCGRNSWPGTRPTRHACIRSRAPTVLRALHAFRAAWAAAPCPHGGPHRDHSRHLSSPHGASPRLLPPRPRPRLRLPRRPPWQPRHVCVCAPQACLCPPRLHRCQLRLPQHRPHACVRLLDRPRCWLRQACPAGWSRGPWRCGGWQVRAEWRRCSARAAAPETPRRGAAPPGAAPAVQRAQAAGYH